jgi:carboxypeptidase A
MADRLITGYGIDETITEMLDTFEFSIIPVLNLDGFVYTHEKNRMWRKNRQPNRYFCVGTDPNRK